MEGFSPFGEQVSPTDFSSAIGPMELQIGAPLLKENRLISLQGPRELLYHRKAAIFTLQSRVKVGFVALTSFPYLGTRWVPT